MHFVRLSMIDSLRRHPRTLVLATTAILVSFAAGCSRSPRALEARALHTGKAYLAKQDYARAVLEFNNAAKAMPLDAEPYFQLGLAYVASGDAISAAQNFRKALDRRRDYTAAQLQLAELESQSRNREAVEDALSRALGVLGRTPENADALNVAGLAELRLGRKEEAKRHLEQALEKFPGHLKASVNLARARLLENDAAGAEAVLKNAAAQVPNSTAPLTALGQFYLIVEKFAEAEQQFQKVLATSSNDPVALANLGQLQWRAKRMDEADQTYRKLAALPGQSYRLTHVTFLAALGKMDQVIAELEQLSRKYPDDRQVRTALVNSYFTANRVSDAEKVLNTALKHWSGDIDALLQRTRLFLSRAKYREAEADLTQVLSLRPTSADAHYLRSKLHQALGEATNRRNELGEALRLDAKMAIARIELSQMLINSNGAKSALTLLDEAPAAQKNSFPFAIQRNWAWLALGDKARVRKEVDQLLAKTRNPELVLQDAALRLADREYGAARKSAEEVLRDRPDDIRALEILMRACTAEKQLDAGIQKLRELALKSPQSVPLQRFLARALVSSGKRPEARQVLESAKSANPSALGIYLDLADLDIAEGKLDAARQYLSALLPSDSRDGAVRGKLAVVEMSAHNYSAAMEHYQKIVALDPRNILALNNLAYLLTDFKQQPDEALKYAQQAKELSPEDAAADDTLGWTYYRKGIYSMAVRHLETAVKREPNARRQYHLAMAYLKLGDQAKSRQMLDAALRLDATLPEAAAAKQLLAEAAARR